MRSVKNSATDMPAKKPDTSGSYNRNRKDLRRWVRRNLWGVRRSLGKMITFCERVPTDSVDAADMQALRETDTFLATLLDEFRDLSVPVSAMHADILAAKAIVDGIEIENAFWADDISSGKSTDGRYISSRDQAVEGERAYASSGAWAYNMIRDLSVYLEWVAGIDLFTRDLSKPLPVGYWRDKLSHNRKRYRG